MGGAGSAVGAYRWCPGGRRRRVAGAQACSAPKGGRRRRACGAEAWAGPKRWAAVGRRPAAGGGWRRKGGQRRSVHGAAPRHGRKRGRRLPAGGEACCWAPGPRGRRRHVVGAEGPGGGRSVVVADACSAPRRGRRPGVAGARAQSVPRPGRCWDAGGAATWSAPKRGVSSRACARRSRWPYATPRMRAPRARGIAPRARAAPKHGPQRGRRRSVVRAEACPALGRRRRRHVFGAQARAARVGGGRSVVGAEA